MLPLFSEVQKVAETNLIQINGWSIPSPQRGLTYTVSTNVNAGRNALGEMIGQRVGRDLYKFDALQWPWLSEEDWGMILQLMSGFFFTVTFRDPMRQKFVTVNCYCGDRTAEPFWIDEGARRVKFFRNCKANIIDCGWPIISIE